MIEVNPALPVQEDMAGLSGRTTPLAGVAVIKPGAHLPQACGQGQLPLGGAQGPWPFSDRHAVDPVDGAGGVRSARASIAAEQQLEALTGIAPLEAEVARGDGLAQLLREPA